MKKHIRILAALLCLLMLIALAGCHEEPAPPESSTTAGSETLSTTSPTSTPTTAPTEPEPQLDAAQLYLDTLAEHDKLQDLRFNLDRVDTMSVGNEIYTTTTSQQIEYLDRGTDDFAARLTETLACGEYESVTNEVFIDDCLYLRVNGSGFTGTMTAEQCLQRYLGANMIDPSLYAAAHAEIVNTGTVLRFSEATALESWLQTDADTLISAEAEITINTEGQLHKIVYHAEYMRANALMTTRIELFCRDSVIDYIEPFPDSSSYISIDCIDAPKQIARAYCLMLTSQSITFSETGAYYITAAGLVDTESYTINTWGSGTDRMVQLDCSSMIMDQSSGEMYTDEWTETFLNGKYTISENGGAPQPDPYVTIEDVDNFILSYLGEALLAFPYIEDLQCTDLGSILLFEIKGNADLADYHKDEMCYTFLGDTDILDDMASDYRTEIMDYYFAIDVFTGLPTAIGVHYEGVHTIDGEEYWLSKQIDQSVYCASLDSYEAITSTSSPDTVIESLATPLFYHVTGDNGQEMWLLGTIHVGDNRTGFLPQEIYNAFHASDALAVECNTRTFEDQLASDEQLQMALSAAYYYADGSTAEDHAGGNAIYERALKLMKATGNYFYSTPFLKVSLWANSIDNFYLRQAYNLSSDKGVDTRLLMLAEDNDKKILEIESSIFQLQMLSGWSEELSQLLLTQAINTDSMEYMTALEELYEMWCSGDEAALTEYLNADAPVMTDEEQKLYEEYNKAMSTDRNAGMVQTAIDYLESGETVFYAVGLAHVLAEDGLVNALRDAGYTVEIVTYK